MTTARHFPQQRTQRQSIWLCWLLLAALLGLQLHAPSHVLAHAGTNGEVALLPWGQSSDNAAGQKGADDSTHAHSPISDCCPAGLLAISQSAPATVVYPTTSPALNSPPPLLADSPVFTPYHSRAPPV